MASKKKKSPEDLMHELSDLYILRDQVQQEKDKLRTSVIPLEVQQALNAIDLEFGPKEEALTGKIEEQIVLVKEAVLKAGASISAYDFTFAYSKPGLKVTDIKTLYKAVLDKAPELGYLFVPTNPSVSKREGKWK